jgi:hypothetical protein
MEAKNFRNRLAFLLLAVATLGAGLAPAQQENARQQTWPILVIHVRDDGGEAVVVDAHVYESTVPLKSAGKVAGRARLKFGITDVAGLPLTDGEELDARVIRAPLTPPGVPFEGHQTVVQPSADYFIRVPYVPDMRYFKAEVQPSSLGGAQKPGRVTMVDLKALIER